MTATRKEHGRVGFDPLAYELIGILDTNPPEGENGEEPADGYGNRLGFTDEAWTLIDRRTDLGGNACDHCGKSLSVIRWIAYAVHRDSGEVVAFGHTCGEDLGFADQFELAKAHARRAADTAKETAARKAALAAWTEAHPDEADVLDRYEARYGEGFTEPGASEYLANMIRARRLYGALTDRQTAFVVKADRQAVEREERRVAREADDAERLANAPDLTAGRHEVTGRFVMTRYQDGDYGSTLKGLFLVDDGNKLWGTVPAAVDDAAFAEMYRQADGWRRHGAIERLRAVVADPDEDVLARESAERKLAEWEAEGEPVRDTEPETVEGLIARQAVTMTVAVEPKEGDSHFGFYKRPTKVRFEWSGKEDA